MPSPGSRPWLRRGLVAAAVVVMALGGVAAFIVLHVPGNVSHPDLQFTPPSTTPAPVQRLRPAVVHNFQWPWYGYDSGRTRFLQTPAKLAPPLRVGWHFFDGALLEFPPVIDHQTLYVLDDDADAKAISTAKGRRLWERKVGTLAASSPAVAERAGLVLMPILSTHGHSPGGGRFVALSMKTGRIAWSRPLSAGSESSPIVHGNAVYFGDQGGTLYARRVSDGHLFWTYHASGAIKGGPALVSGVLYFGDYAGRAYAVDAHTGHQIWAVSTDGAHFGFGSGQFYSTPAVAFGRVYMGNTDGRMYSFGARNGALAWATATGSYVYASAAVADPPGLGPTVYAGSYDGHLYAFNAQSGSIRWSHPAGGKISGSATVLGKVVYYANLAAKTTVGLDVVTGRPVFSFHDGAFNPVIADDQAIYLVGYNTIYQMLPAQSSRPRAKSPKHRQRTARPKPRHRPARPNHRRRAARSKPRHRNARPKPRHRNARSNHRRRPRQRSPVIGALRSPAELTRTQAIPAACGSTALALGNEKARERASKRPTERAFRGLCYHNASMRCRSGSHCQHPAEKGRRFCAEHAAELDRMREELKDAAAARIGRGRPKRSSTCCRPGCYEPRVPPAAYCDTCAAAGYVEEAA